MWLLDTNTLIYFFKNEGKVPEALLARSPRDIAIPAVALFELHVGLARSSAPERRTRQLTELTAVVQVVPFGEREAKAAARIRADLEKAGEPIGPLDTLIAGTALAHGAILVSRNTREFRRIRSLRVEDWYR